MTRSRWIAVSLASLAIGVGATVAVGPRPPSLAQSPPSTDTGDAALAAEVREVFGEGRGHRGIAVAVVEPDGRARLAGVGASGDPDRPQVDEQTRFEIASVTKALTGLLLAEQVARGEVALDDVLGPGSTATLEELATHRSGLPRLPLGVALRALPSTALGNDPYSGDEAEVLALARDAQPAGGADPAYSNLGAAAAGNLLAEGAGARYGQLLTERVLAPLGMSSTTVVTDDDDLPTPRAVGSSAGGEPRDPWVAEGWAPTGSGVWSTTDDLAALLGAVAAGTAPGQDATEPRADYDGRRIGLFWITSDVDGREVTWHNGGSGGFRSFVGVDRDSGRGIAVLGNTDQSVDAEALQLLAGGAS